MTDGAAPASSEDNVGPQDIEVRKEDQNKINRFSRLNTEYTELSEEIEVVLPQLLQGAALFLLHWA